MGTFIKIVVVLILVISIIPFFLNSKFSMSRAIQIQAPIETIFSRLSNLNDYVKWNPFPEGDPTNQASVEGEGVGSYLIWKGEKTGEGKMMITEIIPDKQINIKMEFYKPMSGEGIVKWIVRPTAESNTTEMTWTFEQDLTYFKRYFGLFMESMMGKHFEKGLLNFKSLVEKIN